VIHIAGSGTVCICIDMSEDGSDCVSTYFVHMYYVGTIVMHVFLVLHMDIDMSHSGIMG
jgi:hypothetical protein